jgi:hypothetical protein
MTGLCSLFSSRVFLVSTASIPASMYTPTAIYVIREIPGGPISGARLKLALSQDVSEGLSYRDVVVVVAELVGTEVGYLGIPPIHCEGRFPPPFPAPSGVRCFCDSDVVKYMANGRELNQERYRSLSACSLSSHARANPSRLV